MPPEPREPCRDPDYAEEKCHELMIRHGVTDRRILWAATVAARGAVWLVHLRAAGRARRTDELLVQAASREAKRGLLRHRLSTQLLDPDRCWELSEQLRRIDFAHLPFELTTPPKGWMEDPSATP